MRQLRLSRGLRLRTGDRRPRGRRRHGGGRHDTTAVRRRRSVEDHRPGRVRGCPRRRRLRPRSRAGDVQAARGRRRQHHQHLQPPGRRHLRRRHAGGGHPVRAAAERGEAPRLQARRRRVPHPAGRPTWHGGGRRGSRGLHPADLGDGVKRLGVLGSMVWDTIYGRDPAQPAVEEWGGIAYALAGLDATLGEDWQILPIIKVGRDLAAQANTFLGTLRHLTPGTRFVEVPEPNNRVTLRYETSERRCEQMRGGVPSWTWPELGPLVADLDALYVNFISGFELTLETARLLRAGFPAPRLLYADLHSLFLGKEPDGTRVLQPLPQASAWFGCFDHIQLNEAEMRQLGDDPLAVAVGAMDQGCAALCVTLGIRGAVYFEQILDAKTQRRVGPIRTARIAAPVAVGGGVLSDRGAGDPTGCGDVFGATVSAQLLQGAPLETAVREGCRLAARNVSYRGATGLAQHLLGKLPGA